MIGLLPPIPVAASLAIAGLLLVLAPILPRRAPDVLAIATALGAGALCLLMAHHAAHSGPLVYWFGGWKPHGGQVLGISFVVDEAGAGFAAFIALLFAASMAFAWGYFDEVGGHFHVLMLLFMAGMIGFCLTHDIFNLFVWFEVMSVAAFALTGYALRTSALEGALNFTVVNSIGSYFLLGGIGLIYSRIGALDMGALGAGVAHTTHDPVIAASFTLMSSGLLIKGAQVPYHFWLSDAHAVAPSPVSVIFSGAMVALGLFGVGRIFFTVFASDPATTHLVQTLLQGMGVASALVGGAMALIQRHLKRLLAFSTISHAGIMLIGLTLLSRSGVAGMLLYLVGHGLVKSSLFMVAGILLATRGGIDEIGLRGLGAGIRPAGVAMALGGLLLAGLPVGLMDHGSELVRAGAHDAAKSWLVGVMVFGEACTGGAVLRAAGRIFLGLGPVAGEEERSPTEEEQEHADRPFWLMMAPTTLLLALSLPFGDQAAAVAWHAAASFLHPGAEPIAAHVPDSGASWVSWLSVGLAVGFAAFALSRKRLAGPLVGAVDAATSPLTRGLTLLHSGQIGDYVTWIMVGLALFTACYALG